MGSNSRSWTPAGGWLIEDGVVNQPDDRKPSRFGFLMLGNLDPVLAFQNEWAVNSPLTTRWQTWTLQMA